MAPRKRARGEAAAEGGEDDAAADAPTPKALRLPAPPPGGVRVPPGCALAGLSPEAARAVAATARAQVAAVRTAHHALTAPPGPDGDDLRALDAAYAALLAAASGCASARRLAAAFVPQFAARAPGALDAAAAALGAVADDSACGDRDTPLAAAARDAALRGLGSLAATAVAAHGAESKAAKAAAATLLRRAAASDAHAATAAASLADALPCAPQAVLAALMMAFVAREEPSLRAGARAWADAHLTAESAAAALARAPHTAAWFRAAARAFRGGVPHALALEAWPTIERVIRAAGGFTADDVAPPAAAPPPRHGNDAVGGARLPPPPPPPAPGGGGWRGQLRKSGTAVCELQCFPAGPPPAEGEAPEPMGWPAVLDVLQRAETAHVLGTTLPAVLPRARALRRLLPRPGDAAAAAELRGFCDYLAQRKRCGVVRLAAHGGAPARLLYLVPPGPGVAAALRAREPPREEEAALWALVLPA